MSVRLRFQQPFYGIVYADFDRNSACKIAGNGKEEETIQLPLKGCGTLQVCGVPKITSFWAGVWALGYIWVVVKRKRGRALLQT